MLNMLNLFPFFQSNPKMWTWKCHEKLRGEALVSNISFPDYDLDYDDLGGILSWEQPEDSSQVRMYPPVN